MVGCRDLGCYGQGCLWSPCIQRPPGEEGTPRASWLDPKLECGAPGWGEALCGGDVPPPAHPGGGSGESNAALRCLESFGPGSGWVMEIGVKPFSP